MAHTTRRFLTITFLVDDPRSNACYGFARDIDNVEYFLSRGTIRLNKLKRSDVGRVIEGLTASNPNPVPGKPNLDHVISTVVFSD
jgi:hypothetical protein